MAIGAIASPPAIPEAANSAATANFKTRMADPLYTAPEFGWTEDTSPTLLPGGIGQPHSSHPESHGVTSFE